MHQVHFVRWFLIDLDIVIFFHLQKGYVIVKNSLFFCSPRTIATVVSDNQQSLMVVEGHVGGLGGTAADTEEGEGAHQ